MTAPGRTIFAVAAAATVAAAVIGGLFLIGTPDQERMRRLDEGRANDLRNIYRAVNIYWTTHKNLPPTLAALAREPDIAVKLTDPETGQPYEYRIIAAPAYELCARFAGNSAKEDNTPTRDFWSHGAGRGCYRLEAKSNR